MTATEPPVRTGFDFTNLPLQEVTAVLQTLAYELLDSSLTTDKPPGLNAALDLGPSPIYRNQKSEPCTLYDRLLLARLKIANWKRRFQGTAQRKNAYLQVLDRYDVLVRHAATGKLSAGVRRHLLTGELIRHIQGPVGGALPEDFWRLAGELAWQDMQFQFNVSRKITRVLRKKVVFNIGEIPRVTLSPRVFWTLLVLAKPPRSRFGKRKKIALAMAILAGEGRRQIVAGGWATFWDQWLICEYMRHFPQTILGHDALLESAIRVLPLMAEASVELPFAGNWGAANRQTGMIAAATWREGMPSWMPAWYRTFSLVEEDPPRRKNLVQKFLDLFRKSPKKTVNTD